MQFDKYILIDRSVIRHLKTPKFSTDGENYSFSFF